MRQIQTQTLTCIVYHKMLVVKILANQVHDDYVKLPQEHPDAGM